MGSTSVCDNPKSAECIAAVLKHETKTAMWTTGKVVLAGIVGAFTFVIAMAIKDLIVAWLGLSGGAWATIGIFFLLVVGISLGIMQIDKYIKRSNAKAKDAGLPIE